MPSYSSWPGPSSRTIRITPPFPTQDQVRELTEWAERADRAEVGLDVEERGEFVRVFGRVGEFRDDGSAGGKLHEYAEDEHGVELTNDVAP